MPIALIEAQLAGVPVVATDVGSNSEVVESGVTGVITSQSAQELAAAVSSLVQGPELRKSMGTAAIARAMSEFGMEQMISAHKSAYERLIKRP